MPSTAQMILMTLVPELLVGLASSPSTAQRPYFPAEMWTLPTFGQFYGSKANLNMEALIDAEPQLIVDLGDAKENVRSDMDGIQKLAELAVGLRHFFERRFEEDRRDASLLLDAVHIAADVLLGFAKVDDELRLGVDQCLLVEVGLGAVDLA